MAGGPPAGVAAVEVADGNDRPAQRLRSPRGQRERRPPTSAPACRAAESSRAPAPGASGSRTRRREYAPCGSRGSTRDRRWWPRSRAISSARPAQSMRSSGGGASSRGSAPPASRSRARLRQHEHVLPAHLPQPGRGHHGAHLGVVDQHDAGAERADILVGRLDQLSAGRGDGAGDMAGFVLGRIAHVEAGRASARRAPRANAPASRDRCARCRSGCATRSAADLAQAKPSREAARARRALPLSQASPAERPAHGAVAQRHHLVRHAGVDQRLRADDAAGAARRN